MRLLKEVKSAVLYFIITFLKWMIPILIIIILFLLTNYMITILYRLL